MRQIGVEIREIEKIYRPESHYQTILKAIRAYPGKPSQKDLYMYMRDRRIHQSNLSTALGVLSKYKIIKHDGGHYKNYRVDEDNYELYKVMFDRWQSEINQIKYENI